MAQHNEPIWVDSLGNVFQGSTAIGYYDSVTKKCYDYDSNEFPCPIMSPEDVPNQPIKTSTRTYWWMVLVLFCLLVIFIAWFINRK